MSGQTASKPTSLRLRHLPLRTIIAGTRTVPATVAYDAIERAVFAASWEVSAVISGHRGAVDKAGEVWANENRRLKILVPYPGFLGRRGGPIRNSLMEQIGQALIAVWDGRSRGTKDMIDKMDRAGRPVHVERV